jgi:CheY-like chemotaxis protein
MSDSIIAVVPATSDVDSVQQCLSPEGVSVKFVNSLEEALRLLAAGSTPVFFCDTHDRTSWREPITRLLRSGTANRVVLLSTLAGERTPSEQSAPGNRYPLPFAGNALLG